MTQKEKVLHWLRNVGPLTALQALDNGMGMRLASHIHSLTKKDGHAIRTEMVKGDDGSGFARYHYVHGPGESPSLFAGVS